MFTLRGKGSVYNPVFCRDKNKIIAKHMKDKKKLLADKKKCNKPKAGKKNAAKLNPENLDDDFFNLNQPDDSDDEEKDYYFEDA